MKPPNEAGFSVREGLSSDLDLVRSLSEAAFQVYGPYGDLLGDWLVSGSVITFVACAGRVPAGFAMLGPASFPYDDGYTGEILAIAVRQRFRRRGAGRLLVENVIGRARAAGFKMLLLFTSVGNIPARELFGSLDFTESGVRRRFYPMGQDAVLMYREIAPMSFESWSA